MFKPNLSSRECESPNPRKKKKRTRINVECNLKTDKGGVNLGLIANPDNKFYCVKPCGKDKIRVTYPQNPNDSRYHDPNYPMYKKGRQTRCLNIQCGQNKTRTRDENGIVRCRPHKPMLLPPLPPPLPLQPPPPTMPYPTSQHS